MWSLGWLQSTACISANTQIDAPSPTTTHTTNPVLNQSIEISVARRTFAAPVKKLSPSPHVGMDKPARFVLLLFSCLEPRVQPQFQRSAPKGA